MVGIHVVFFFSSRRRHTRWNCDWSSDVCSSDLGEFPIQPMMGTQGTNLAKFDLINNVFEGLATTDHQVSSLLMFNGKIYVSGEFETNLYTDTVHYIGRLDNVLKVNNK